MTAQYSSILHSSHRVQFLCRNQLDPNVNDSTSLITKLESLRTLVQPAIFLVPLRGDPSSLVNYSLAKLAVAGEATALARRNTKLLVLEALEVDGKSNL